MVRLIFVDIKVTADYGLTITVEILHLSIKAAFLLPSREKLFGRQIAIKQDI